MPQGRPLCWTRLPKTTVYALQDKNQDRQANEPRLYQEKYHIRELQWYPSNSGWPNGLAGGALTYTGTLVTGAML